MEIKTTNTASFDLKAVNKIQDLLLKFEASSFKAIISHKLSDQSFLINTKAGPLQIKTDLPVLSGDELILKVKSNKTNQFESLEILKIIRPTKNAHQSVSNPKTLKNISPIILINNPVTLKSIPKTQPHFVAKIISQDKTHFTFQSLKGEAFTISKKILNNDLINTKTGEYITVKWTPAKNIELQGVNKEQLLHQAQRQLLPKQHPFLQTHQRLSQAAFKLFESINQDAKQLMLYVKPNNIQNKPISSTVDTQKMQLKPETTVTASQTKQLQALHQLNNKSSLESLIKIIKDNPVLLNSKKISINPEILLTVKNIKQDFNKLLTSNRIILKFLASDTVLKLLNNLNNLSQTKTPDSNNQSFTQKLSIINQSIDKLLIQLTEHSNKANNSSKEEDTFLELLKGSLKDARQSIEASLSKILFQNTSSKLHQEINNALLINTQIPFVLEKQTKDLHLKIKQHKKESEEQDDAWEIQLALEMGLLGLISTKILLKNHNDVSIQFWAELENTRQLIEDKKSLFQKQMTNSGFILKDINIYFGKKIEEAMPINIANKQFIDINA